MFYHILCMEVALWKKGRRNKRALDQRNFDALVAKHSLQHWYYSETSDDNPFYDVTNSILCFTQKLVELRGVLSAYRAKE